MGDENALCNQICKLMGKYYESKGVAYNNLFSEWADGTGYEDEALLEDLANEDYKEADCVDFVDYDDEEEFPRSQMDKEPKEEIFYWIKQFSNPTFVPAFDVKFPTINNANYFDVTKEEIAEIQKIYSEQCPAIYTAGMQSDDAFLQIINVGRKEGFRYLEYVIHDYFRSKVKNIDATDSKPDSGGFQADAWFNGPHIKWVEKLGASPGSNPLELTQNAIKSFNHRCCPKLVYTALFAIDDRIEIIMNYVESCMDWINELVKSSDTVCPFQVDLCIATGEPVSTETKQGADQILGFLKKQKQQQQAQNDEDDDDDDPDIPSGGGEKKEEEAIGYVEMVQDIAAKLNANKLPFVKSKFNGSGGELPKTRFYGEMLKNLSGKLGKNEYPLKGSFQYPHRARFLMMVDRRDKETEDDVFMYTAPANCRDIPSNYVPEWFISASKATLLPDLEYGDGQNAMKRANERGDGSKETADRLKKDNINTTHHVKGGLITFSFIAEEEDRIKVYLYFNGQLHHFMPEDVKLVLPKIFNVDPKQKAKYAEINLEWIENEADKRVESMQTKLKDKWLQAFQNSYYVNDK